jgi:hypothetical protein
MTSTKKVRCATCGYALRRYRPEKRCPTCGQTKAAQDFLHARSRNDHLGSQCRDCQRERQRTSYRKERFEARHSLDKPGRVTPLAELNPVVDGYLVGRFESKRRLAEYVSEPHRQPVYRVRLADAISNDGTALGQVDIVHTAETVAAAHLTPGGVARGRLRRGLACEAHETRPPGRCWPRVDPGRVPDRRRSPA